MSGYIGTQPVPQATQHRETFTATASQTTFATVGYTPQFVDVYLNGVHLLDTVDYTATNSSDVVLTTGAAASDVVEIISYTPFEVANQTFTGTTTVDVLTATGAFTSLGIDDNATSTAITIDASENVGIGTSSPSANLHVLSSGDAIARVTSADGSGAFLDLGDASDPDGGRIVYDSGSNLTFSTASTERMRVDASGNVLVGKTTPSISTAGTALRGDNAGLINSARNGVTLELNRLSTDGTIQEFFKDGSTVGSIGTVSGDLTIGTGDTGLSFDDANDTVQPISATAGNGRDGALTLGGPFTRFKDLYLSGGVYLGGTGSANKLDDYEEGTWTPTDASTANLTFTSNTGVYTKTGRLVICSYRLFYPTTSNTAAALVSGLPFASGGGFPTGYNGYNSCGVPINHRLQGQTFFVSNASSGATINNSTLSGKEIQGTFIYHA